MAIVGRHPDGVGLDGLLRALGAAIPRRTLQRRMRSLIEQHRVVTAGAGRALKYRAPL